MKFTYQDLDKLFSYIKKNYPVFLMGTQQYQRGIILRHDIDLDLNAAQKMAALEKKHGLRSTFFVMTTCQTYNPFAGQNRQIITQLVRDDFEIGLHFDGITYGNVTEEKLASNVRAEAKILSSITGQKVRSISQHRPVRSGKYYLFRGFQNAYDPRIFSPEQYISDSHRHFIKDIFEFLNQAQKFPIQILLHPFNYATSEKNYIQLISRYLDVLLANIDADFRKMSTYRVQVKEGELKQRLLKKI